MQSNKKDKIIISLLVIGLFLDISWGLHTGELQKIFRKKSKQEIEAAEQRAIDHLFGSDIEFDPNSDNITKTSEGASDTISWKILSKVKFVQGKSGNSSPYKFDESIKNLDGKEITITGYIFPLQAADKQNHFLLSAYPPSCPYCLPAGPDELIEVKASDDINFTYEAVTIHGTFHVLSKSEQQEGMFYGMTDSKKI